MATIPPLRLSRSQLAQFLQDQEQIRAFENLFRVVEPLADGSSSSDFVEIGLAQASANEALATIASVAQEAAVSCAMAENKANQALALVGDLASTVEGLQMQPPIPPRKRQRFGQFWDTTTQTAAAINTAYAVTYNNSSALNQGVVLRSPSEVQVDTEGVYNFQFSIQLDKTSGGSANFWTWWRVNGVNVPASASQIQIQGNNHEIFGAANILLDLKAGDVVQLMWAVSDTAVQLQYFPASGPVPEIPSVILTVTSNIRSEP